MSERAGTPEPPAMPSLSRRRGGGESRPGGSLLGLIRDCPSTPRLLAPASYRLGKSFHSATATRDKRKSRRAIMNIQAIARRPPGAAKARAMSLTWGRKVTRMR